MKHNFGYINEHPLILVCHKCGKKFTLADVFITENQCCHGPSTPETPQEDPPDKQ